MPPRTVPLAKLNLVYSREAERRGRPTAGRRILVWTMGLLIAALLWFGVPVFFAWKHVISSRGGHYFVHRVVIPVPVFSQDDPRWTFELLGPTYETLGQAGCAITSAAMVLSGYGVDTDPGRLNQYLTTHGGYTPDGAVYWEKAAEIAPAGEVQKAYEDLPSYALIDENLLAGNPVIVRLTLHNGRPHFVVIVGKEGWNYLIRDPARSPSWGIYPLKYLVSEIQALRFFRVVPPSPEAAAPIVIAPPPAQPAPETTPAPPAAPAPATMPPSTTVPAAVPPVPATPPPSATPQQQVTPPPDPAVHP